MGGKAFAYYFPVIERYVRDSQIDPEDEYDEVDSMWILAHDIANQLRKSQIGYVRSLLARISDLAAHVRGHLGQYCIMADDQQRVDVAWAELQITLQEANRNRNG